MVSQYVIPIKRICSFYTHSIINGALHLGVSFVVAVVEVRIFRQADVTEPEFEDYCIGSVRNSWGIKKMSFTMSVKEV